MKIFILAVLVIVALSISETEFKHNQGPPEEFDLYKLPKPTETPTTSDSAIQHIYLSKVSDDEYEWKGDVMVDSLEYLSVTMASKLKNLVLEMVEPANKGVAMVPEIHHGFFGYDAAKVPTTTYAYNFDSDKRGVWTARITTKQSEISDDGRPHISLFIENRSIFKAYSTTATLKTHVGKDVGLVTRLYASAKRDAPEGTPIPIKINNRNINMALILPNGVRQVVRMQDNGQHMDGDANDGVYGATVKAQDEGSYVAQVIMRGTTPEGYEFMRTTQHLIEVVEHDFDFMDKAEATIVGEEVQLKLFLDDKAKEVVGEKFKAYAEVWDNEETPIAWVSGMTIVKQNENGQYYVPLHLNLKWLSTKAGKVMNPTILKNLYINHGEKNIQVTSIDKAVVSYPTKIDFAAAPKFNGVFTEDMTMGPRPAKYATKAQGQGKVVLVHGYCTEANPFSTTSFENWSAFLDPKANRNHDAFALKLKEHIEPFGSGVAFVAHSQGGFATTHLYTFYWSQTDMTKEATGRIIQTVGTPFLGTKLAGSLANLGTQLGYGCGNNNDMTYDGAKNWIATIPLASRKVVHSYITQYADWSWCSIVVNAVLSWPNDGVTEGQFTQLEGSNYYGTKKGYCHTTDMKYPAHGTDEVRNKEMNANAAR